MARHNNSLVLVLVALAVGVVGLCNGANDFVHDPCHITTNTSPNGDETQVVSLDIPCTNGTIDWHYPRGSLHLRYAKDLGVGAGFSFCVLESWATYYGGLTDLTNGRHKPMAMPTKDTPSCVTSSHKGQTVVSVSAAREQYYMTSLMYSVVMDHNRGK